MIRNFLFKIVNEQRFVNQDCRLSEIFDSRLSMIRDL